MRTKTLFIVNPISGVGRQKKIESLLKQNLNHDLFDYTVRYTEYAHHATELTRQAVEQGVECVVAVGGDGSVNDVVQGLVGTSVRLGIIPCGSGNGLASSLRLPTQPWLAIRALNQQHPMTIDSLLVNDQYVCVNAAGVGFDAYISRLMKVVKSRGLTAYTNLVMRAYAGYNNHTYSLTIGNRTLTRSAWIIAMQNSSRIGFNVPVAPNANLQDGIIDISIVDKVPLDHVPITMSLLLNKHLQLSQHVEMFRTSEVYIEGNDDKWADIDGEAVMVGTTVHIVNQPHSISLFGRDLNRPLLIRTPQGQADEAVK